MAGNKTVRARDLVGKKVVLKNGIHVDNGAVLPKGMILDAVGFGSALHLSSGPCPSCGAGVELRNVPVRFLAPLDGAGKNLYATYPAVAYWKAAGTGFVECSRCGRQARIGSDPVTCACGLDAGELYWKHCPGCGAGMALPEQLSYGKLPAVPDLPGQD